MCNKKASKSDKKLSRLDIVKVVALVLICIGLVVATICLMPYVVALKDDDVRKSLKEYINSKGVFGVLIVMGIQVLQVVVAFIPGEFVEVLSGLLYGTFYGYLICTIGVLIGSIIIYYTVRTLGYSLTSKIFGDGKLSKFKFLDDQKRLDIIVFLLFFIPGTPKDLLTYFIPFTKMKPIKFFIISALARVPSIISSTFAGASIGEGKWMQTAIIFVIIGVIGIGGIIFNEKFVSKLRAKKHTNNNP